MPGDAPPPPLASPNAPVADGYVRSFNRFELKYVLPERRARAFARGLEGYAVSDAHSAPRSAGEVGPVWQVVGYPVRSVYWDSPELTFFWEKIDGEKYRRKLRLRTYADPAGGGEPQVFVEIKQRIDRTVQKRRTRIPLARARALFPSGSPGPGEPGAPGAEVGPNGSSPTASELRDPVLAEALFLCRFHRLEPKMAVAYRREAWFGAHEQDLRITFDRRLRYDPHALDPGGRFERGTYVLPPDQVVVEIKFNDEVPLWLVRLAQTCELELVRMSKYCSAVDRAWFDGELT